MFRWSVALTLSSAVGWATDGEQVSEGLSGSDWSSIRKAYEARRHAAFAVAGGYQARNLGQGWRTRFDGHGFLTTPEAGGWSWGLKFLHYGRSGIEQTVTAPSRVEALIAGIEPAISTVILY